MDNQELKEELKSVSTKEKYKDQFDKIAEEKIKHLCDLIDRIPDYVYEKIHSVKYFISTLDNPSRTDASLNSILDSMIEDVRSYINEKQKRFQESAIAEMRKSKKGVVISAIIILCFIAGVAVVLGVLGAFKILPEVCCDIVGVADCMFGISFFVYELYSDRLTVSAINSGDVEKITKYTKQVPIYIGTQTNVRAQVNNGTVWGNMTMNVVSDQTEIVVSDQTKIRDIVSKLYKDE